MHGCWACMGVGGGGAACVCVCVYSFSLGLVLSLSTDIANLWGGGGGRSAMSVASFLATCNTMGAGQGGEGWNGWARRIVHKGGWGNVIIVVCMPFVLWDSGGQMKYLIYASPARTSKRQRSHCCIPRTCSLGLVQGYNNCDRSPAMVLNSLYTRSTPTSCHFIKSDNQCPFPVMIANRTWHTCCVIDDVMLCCQRTAITPPFCFSET